LFVGHAGLALAAKRKLPDVSLGWLVAATYGLDLLWPVFLLLGIERVRIAPGATAFTQVAFDHYPWSHSLLMSMVWGGVVFALATWRGVSRRSALIVGAIVVSLWFLDLLMHAPDLQLSPGSSVKLGLGLWNSVAGTLAVEGLFFIACITLYLRSSRARDWIGVVAFWSLLLMLTVIWASGPFAPPPPSEKAIAIVGLTGPLFPLWAEWAGRHRQDS
jgi:hypothetical protein